MVNSRHKADSGTKKKIKIGLSVLAFVFVIGLGLVSYLGIKVAGAVIANAPSKQQTEVIAQNILKHSQTAVIGVTSVNCWTTIQSHLNVSKWLISPISENIAAIVNACLVFAEVKDDEKQSGAVE